jgi:hypothetical protein
VPLASRRRHRAHDRAIDGVNQLPFFEGKQTTSNRESMLLYANAQLLAVK